MSSSSEAEETLGMQQPCVSGPRTRHGVSLLGRGRWDPGAGPFCVFPVLSCHLGSARDQGADPLTEPRMAAPAPWEDTGEARSIPPPIPPPPPLIL